MAVQRGVSSFAVTGLDDFEAGWFTAGRLVFTSGANSGLAVEINLRRLGVAAGSVGALNDTLHSFLDRSNGRSRRKAIAGAWNA